jgi:PRTRC genetic system protein B
MKSITKTFSEMQLPVKALLFYNNLSDDRDVRVEAFDINEYGHPINAHPLSVNESKALAKSLSSSHHVYTGFLQYHGIILNKVLFVDATEEGFAIWYTPAGKANLLFKPELTIPCGEAHLPPLVWKATSQSVEVFALTDTERPGDETPLYHAPFFNLHIDGRVCMGTVDIDFEEDCNVIDFMHQWEHYFFNSYFSHAIDNIPLKSNLISLWQELLQTQAPFPMEVLKPNGKKLKDLII